MNRNQRLELLLLCFSLAVTGALAACDAEDPPHEPKDLTVAVDALPGQWPNTIDFAAAGTIEVAILARGWGDATTIDSDSLIAHDLDGTAEVRFSGAHREADIDGDGQLDFVGVVDLGELTAAGILDPDEKTRLVVTAETERGDQLTGWDVVLDASRPTLELPAPSGPHPVGLVELDWTDTSRTNEIGPQADAPRRIKVQIRYPADLGAGAQPSPAWLSWDEAKAMAAPYFQQWLGLELPAALFDYVSTPATPNAPLAADSPLPVLIFSSILGIPPPAESAIVNDVASHGFVVVSIYHTYVTGPVSFSDGELVVDYVDHPLQDTLPIAVADIHFVLDRVEELAASDPRFEGALDLNRIGVFGFAFGGTSAVEASVDEPRFLATLNIDGPPMGRALEEGLEQPFLLINARSAPNRSNPADLRPRLLSNVRGPAYSLTLPSAGGLNFCDYALHESLMQEVDSTAAVPDLGIIDRALAFQIINDYIVAFFSTHVASTPVPLLGEPSPYPEASFLEWE